MEQVEPLRVPNLFSDYSKEERRRFKSNIKSKQGKNLTPEERRFLRLKEEFREMEREDDQPRYGH